MCSNLSGKKCMRHRNTLERQIRRNFQARTEVDDTGNTERESFLAREREGGERWTSVSHDETASGYSTVYNVCLADEKYGIKRPILKWSNIFRIHPCSVINICLFVFFSFFNDRDSSEKFAINLDLPVRSSPLWRSAPPSRTLWNGSCLARKRNREQYTKEVGRKKWKTQEQERRGEARRMRSRVVYVVERHASLTSVYPKR